MEDSRQITKLRECVIFDSWKVSRQVLLQHFKSFGFHCILVDTFDDLCNLDHAVDVVVTEYDSNLDKEKMKMTDVNARFKIGVSRLRSPNEVIQESGIDVIISRHIKRDSLRQIVNQLLESGSIDPQKQIRHNS